MNKTMTKQYGIGFCDNSEMTKKTYGQIFAIGLKASLENRGGGGT